MRKGFFDTQKNALLRKFHAMLREAGIDNDGKKAMLSSYGVDSSKDLTVYELTELCGKIDTQLNSKAKELDVLRKRVMASIGQYLKKVGRDGDAELIKAIACRATGYDSFNKIPVERLRNMTYMFNNKVKDLDSVENEIMTTKYSLN